MVTPVPFASFSDAIGFGSGQRMLRDIKDPAVQDRLMMAASKSIENQCQRRLMPFTGLVESVRAQDVDQDILGAADMPMDMAGALGYSQAVAFASVSMVRDIMLEQWAPVQQDNWAYNVDQIKLIRAFGDTQFVNVSQIEGPYPDTGRFRFHLGIFCPVGTTVQITYDGGYQETPDDLWQACIYRAFKFAVVGAEPEKREALSTAELDAEVLTLIAPYIR